MIAASVAHLPNVEVTHSDSPVLVVDVARQVGADVIVKGLRVASDAESELQQAQMNKAVSGIETIFVPCSSAYSFIASKWLRDFMSYGGAERVGAMVPATGSCRHEGEVRSMSSAAGPGRRRPGGRGAPAARRQA